MPAGDRCLDDSGFFFFGHSLGGLIGVQKYIPEAFGVLILGLSVMVLVYLVPFMDPLTLAMDKDPVTTWSVK